MFPRVAAGEHCPLAFEVEMVKAEDSRGSDPQIRFRSLSASLNRVARRSELSIYVRALPTRGFRRDQP